MHDAVFYHASVLVLTFFLNICLCVCFSLILSPMTLSNLLLNLRLIFCFCWNSVQLL